MKVNSCYCIFCKFYAIFINKNAIMLEYSFFLMYNAYAL